MNTVVVRAVTPNGRKALKAYVDKFKSKKPSLAARVVARALPFREEVDNLDNPKELVVTLGRALEGQAHLVMPKIEKNIINVLCKFGGVSDDFEVDFK